jgi:hypothetical protein
VTDEDLVRAAAGQLYSAEPGAFIERRAELAAQARSAGDAPAARSIAALRKPTRSAWVLNQLARAEPGATGELEELGEDLRAAQRSLDGAALRELSLRRRRLIGALAARAFAVCGLASPPAALRDEVTATLGAAMTDLQVAGQLRDGTLDRAVRRDGFGPDAPPPLTVVPGSSEGRRTTAAPGGPAAAKAAAGPAAGRAAGPRAAATARPAARTPAKPAAGTPAKPAARAPAKPADLAAARQAKAASLAAEREAAERERRRLAVVAAEQAAAEANQAAAAAGLVEREREQAVELLEQQLADARRDLSDARLAARRARTRQRQARQALGRLHG